MSAKILTVDIETSPIVAHVWGTRLQNVAINQILEPTRMLCFAAKWQHEKKVQFYSEHHDGRDVMIAAAHRLFDEAQVLVHFNGQSFDRPHINREFLLASLNPPSPYQQVDLLRIARKQFRFASNKLQYLLGQLGLEGKVEHEGHGLWIKCLAGDPKAWAVMKRYNIGDVRKTEQLYDRLLPWISNHPHIGLLTSQTLEDCCNKCGSTDLVREGYAHTAVSSFAQYHCRQCGGWSRGKKAVARVDARGVAA